MEEPFATFLNQRIDLSLPLALNLAKLDSIVKQLAISPTSPSALDACRTLCRHYINRTPPPTSSEPSSPSQVNDPEVFAHFSFAKSKHQANQYPSHLIKPERLFMGSEQQKKGRSQDVFPLKNHKNNQGKHYVSSFNLPLVLDQRESASVQDVKQMSRLKIQEIEDKQEELSMVRKKKRINELFKYIREERIYLKEQLKIRSAEFMYRSALSQKTLMVLKEEHENGRNHLEKAVQFLSRNDETTLEEYFLAWKQRALMTQAERQFQLEVDMRRQKLSRMRVFWRLKANHARNQADQDKIQENTTKAIDKLSIMKRQSFFRALRDSSMDSLSFQAARSSLVRFVKHSFLNGLADTVKKVAIFRERREKNKTERLLRTVKGRKLISNMKNDLDLVRVYWKTPRKIFFLKMILEAIKDSMLRKGYCEQQWMQQLPRCLERTDKQLNNIVLKHQLGRTFFGLKTYLEMERAKRNEVVMLHGRRLIKQLLNNYKLSILRQKEEYQLGVFFEVVMKDRVRGYLQVFRENTSKLIAEKQQKVCIFLKNSKIKEVFKHLMVYKLAKSYYQDQISGFGERQDLNFLRKVFQGFKRVTLTAIVNNRICDQFTAFRNRCLKQKIFACLKHFTFEEKLLKKRIKTFVKIRLASYFQGMTFNMRVAMYGGQKQRDLLLQQKQDYLLKKNEVKKVKDFFKVCRRTKLKKIIQDRIDTEYQFRHVWKVFNVMKVVTRNQKREKELAVTIAKRKQKNCLEKTVDSMVNSLLMKLLLKNVENIALRSLIRAVFEKIEVYKPMEEGIQQESNEKIEDISDISQK